MRARVSMTTLNRLKAVEQARGQRKYAAMFPKLLPVDEWGAVSARMQAELKANIKKDCAPQYDKGDLSFFELVASG